MRHRTAFLLALTAAACGGGNPSKPGPTPTALAVACGTISFSAAGQQTQCNARLTFSDNTTQDQTNSAQWSSSSPTVASVSATGFVTAAQPGTATITATYQGTSGTATLTVGGGAIALINSITMSTRTTKAIRGTTVVHIDITGSTGSTLLMNFGDGTTSSTPDGCFPTRCEYFEHSYNVGPGTYYATLTATDSFGHTANAQKSVTVTDLSGIWSNTILNPSNGRTETRLITLAGDTGSYTHPEGNTEPLTFGINSYGSIHITLPSGTISMTGIDLDNEGLTSDTTFRVVVSGGTANGLTLTFTKQ